MARVLLVDDDEALLDALDGHRVQAARGPHRAGQVSLAVQALLGGVLMGVLAFAALLYRSLERFARTERSDAYIRQHLGREPGVES